MTNEIKPDGWLIDVGYMGASHKDLKIFTPVFIEKYTHFYVDDHPDLPTAKPVYFTSPAELGRYKKLEELAKKILSSNIGRPRILSELYAILKEGPKS